MYGVRCRWKEVCFLFTLWFGVYEFLRVKINVERCANIVQYEVGNSSKYKCAVWWCKMANDFGERCVRTTFEKIWHFFPSPSSLYRSKMKSVLHIILILVVRMIRLCQRFYRTARKVKRVDVWHARPVQFENLRLIARYVSRNRSTTIERHSRRWFIVIARICMPFELKNEGLWLHWLTARMRE